MEEGGSSTKRELGHGGVKGNGELKAATDRHVCQVSPVHAIQYAQLCECAVCVVRV